MVVGTGFPVMGSCIVFGTWIAFPSTVTEMVSATATGVFWEIRPGMGMALGFRRGGDPGLLARTRTGGSSCFVGHSSRHKLLFEFVYKTLDGPGAGFTKCADGPASRDIVRDPEQVISVDFS